MFGVFSATDSRQNDYGEGFSHDWEFITTPSLVNETNLTGIPSGQSMDVLFKPLSGIFRQRKYLPIRYMPLTIELLLVDNGTDPIISHASNYGDVDHDFTDVNTSYARSIQHVQAKCDLTTLDSGLNDSYVKLLEEGKKLTINYNTFISQYQTWEDKF